jgi:sigma-E factor negative regulatory protein RseA
MMSALADGELHGEALSQCLHDVLADPALHTDWAAYHLIGDVLRSPELASGAHSTVFMTHLRDRLQSESVAASPSLQPALAGQPDVVLRPLAEASNDGNFRWKLVAGFASIAAVAAIGWNALSLSGGSLTQPQLASAPAAQPVLQASAENNVMIRDARLDELMAAHRQLGSGAAIQMPSGALRNAAFEAQVR